MCLGISVNLGHPEQSSLERSLRLTMEFGSDCRSVHLWSSRDRRLTKLPNEEGSSLTAVNVKLM